MKTIYSSAFLCFFLVALSSPAQVNPTTPPTAGSAATNGLSAAETAALEADSNALQVATFVVLTNDLVLVSPPGLSPSNPTTAPATDPSTSDAATMVVATNALQPVTVTLLQSQSGAASSTLSAALGAGGMSPLDLTGDCVQPPSGLVGWWQAENNALDSAGSNVGQRIGGDTYGGGELGQAFLFNGSSQYVSLPNLSTPNFTIEAWIYPDSQVSWQAFIFGQSYGRQLILNPWGSGLCVSIYITTTGGSFYGLPDMADQIPYNAWTHIAATWDSTSLVLYVNGSPKAQAAPGFSTIGDSGCTFSIGASGSCAPSQYFPGLIDEMSLYSRALSANEISAIVQAGSAGKCPLHCTPCPASAVAWWPGEQTASDVLGGHDGTPSIPQVFVTGKVGEAFSFTGDNSVQIPNSGLISASWSIEAWVSPTGSISAQAFILGQAYGRQLIARPGNKVAVAIAPDGYNWRVLESDPILIGWWTHVVATYDAASGTLSLYVNGVGRSSSPGVVPWDSGCVWSMGGLNNACGASGQWFSGAVDEVTLYNSALSSVQVQAIYAAGKAGKCPPGQFNVVNVSHMQYHEAEPTIAVNPNLNGSGYQDMYVLSVRPSAYGGFGGEIGLMAARSTDGGYSWLSTIFATGPNPVPSGLLINPPNLPMCDGGDPCAVYDSHGNLFISYLTGLTTYSGGPWRVVVAELPAGGTPWVQLDNGTFTGKADQTWLAVGPAPANSPCPETLWLCYSGDDWLRIAGAFVDSAGNVGPFVQAQNLPGPGSSYVRHQRVAVGSAGQVMCVYQDLAGSGRFGYSFSDRGLGGTFLNPVIGNTDFTTSFSLIQPQRTLWNTLFLGSGFFYPAPWRGVCNGPEIVWDHGRNRIYVAYTDLHSNSILPNTDVYVQYVDYSNQGMIWHPANNGAPINSQGGGTAQFMSAIAVDQASGNVAVGWYDSRSDSVNNRYVQYYAAVSRDGASTFGGNFALTPGQSNASLLTWGADTSQDFLDYTALAYVGGVLYAVWADNANSPVQNFSNGSSFLDIYMAFGIPSLP